MREKYILFSLYLPPSLQISVLSYFLCVNFCETLHPQNIIAQLYTKSLSQTDKNSIIVAMNDSIEQKDHASYKKIVKQMKQMK
jgi:hypothetical protein